MDRKTKNIQKTFFVILICLTSSLAFGQVNFEDAFLKLQEKIAYTTNYSTVTSFMANNNYPLDEESTKALEEEATNEGMKGYVFKGSYSQLVIVGYNKEKKLTVVRSNLLTLSQTFSQLELENKGFKNIKEETKTYDDMVITYKKFEKAGYPYRFELEETEGEKIGWLSLFTKLHEEY